MDFFSSNPRHELELGGIITRKAIRTGEGSFWVTSLNIPMSCVELKLGIFSGWARFFFLLQLDVVEQWVLSGKLCVTSCKS